MRRWRAGLAALAVLAAGGCTADADPAPAPSSACGASQRRVADVPYDADGGHDGLTTLDLYPLASPTGCAPTPILVWVHGGGWQIGDKRNQLDDKRRLAAEQGWMLVSVNYRLVPEVRYPVPNEDVAAAVSWVLEHAAEYGADPDRLAVMGHSAGGGIVAAITTDERYLSAYGHALSDVDCAVSLDTEGYDVAARGDQSAIYEAMFGSDPAQWPDQSPINHVAAGKGIPYYFIVTRGLPSRVETAQRFATALRAAGVPTTVVVATGLSHNEVNQAVGRAGDTVVTPPLVEFLSSCFAAAGAPSGSTP